MSTELQKTEPNKWTPPTIQELTESLESFAHDDILNIALNQPPPQRWVKQHSTIKVKVKTPEGQEVSVPLQYIPIDRQRLLARRLFGIVQVEIKSTQQMFNAVCVTVRIHYKHPISGEQLFMDGVGGVGVQTDANAMASDMSKIKFDGVMKAAPAAAAYAEKNAYDKLGLAFGGEMQREAIQFNENWAMYAKENYDRPTLEDLRELYELKKEALTPDEIANAERILNNNENNSFNKLHKLLQSK